MKQLLRSVVLLLVFSVGKSAGAADLPTAVQTAFSQMRVLRDMNPQQQYTLTVAGKPETGPKELFLRRRESAEILKSGLSCGCGDYAIAFLRLMEAQGVETRLIDGAEVSTASLANHFSGHAVVAVRDPKQRTWWLVNSTDRTVLSKHWAPQSPFFQAFSLTFWIGYNGPISHYPARNATELERFYTATLRKVPVAFFNQHLRRLDFTVDPSLRDSQGKYSNPRLAKFLAFQTQIFQAYHVHPLQVVKIDLLLGQANGDSRLERSASGRWRGTIGLSSACSPSLFAYFEQRINSS